MTSREFKKNSIFKVTESRFSTEIQQNLQRSMYNFPSLIIRMSIKYIHTWSQGDSRISSYLIILDGLYAHHSVLRFMHLI